MEVLLDYKKAYLSSMPAAICFIGIKEKSHLMCNAGKLRNLTN